MQSGAPRQGMLIEDAKGIITLKEEYVKGLDYLSSFEYIWVIYHFNEAEGWENVVNRLTVIINSECLQQEVREDRIRSDYH